MKLFLIRHGQSEANLQAYFTGQMDVALTELGKVQAANLAQAACCVTVVQSCAPEAEAVFCSIYAVTS